MRRCAAAAFVLVIALAGCGGGGGGGGGGGSASASSIEQAAAKTAQAGSVKTDFTVSGGGAKASGNGVFNTSKDRSGKVAMVLEVNGRKSTLDSIVTRNVLYMRAPFFAQAGIAGSQEWVKLDLVKLAQQRGLDLSSLVNASPTPNSVLAYLKGAGKVKKVGNEKVQGTDTTHYQVTVDLERAAKRSDARTAQSIRNVMRLSGLKTIPVDAWIDGQGYLRKVRWAEHTSPVQAAKVTMLLHDFGPPVQIKPPPPGNTLDLLQRLSGGQG
jgi:hypothetical protein